METVESISIDTKTGLCFIVQSLIRFRFSNDICQWIVCIHWRCRYAYLAMISAVLRKNALVISSTEAR